MPEGKKTTSGEGNILDEPAGESWTSGDAGASCGGAPGQFPCPCGVSSVPDLGSTSLDPILQRRIVNPLRDLDVTAPTGCCLWETEQLFKVPTCHDVSRFPALERLLFACPESLLNTAELRWPGTGWVAGALAFVSSFLPRSLPCNQPQASRAEHAWSPIV